MQTSIPRSTRDPGPGRRASRLRARVRGGGGQAGDCQGKEAGPQPPEFPQGVASHQVVDGRRLYVHAGDRIARRVGTYGGAAEGAPLGEDAFGSRRVALRGDFPVLDIEQRANDHDLAVELPTEELWILVDARAQIGEREGRNVVRPAVEIERGRIRCQGRNAVAAERHGAVRLALQRCALARDASSTDIDGTVAPSTTNVSGTRRTTSSGSL